MNARALIFLLCITTVAGMSSFAATPGKKDAPPPKREQLFIGSGNITWLPKSSILPTAADIEVEARKLSSRVRNMDPFGLPTFPTEETMQPTEPQFDRPAQRITLNQALQSLKVTGINLDKKEILFRGRNVFQGDVMVIAYKNEVFLAEVLEVSSTQILFRDVKRLETGVLPHTLVPHLELEPVRKHAGLEGKVSPMESTKSSQP
jgi:hypothetical protein